MIHEKTSVIIIFFFCLFQLHHYYMQERYRKSQEGKSVKWMEMHNLKFDPRLEQRMTRNEAISSTTAENPQQIQAEEDESPPSPFEYREGEESQPINLVKWADELEAQSIPKKCAVKRPSSLVFNTDRAPDDGSSSVKIRKRYTRRCVSEPGNS